MTADTFDALRERDRALGRGMAKDLARLLGLALVLGLALGLLVTAAAAAFAAPPEREDPTAEKRLRPRDATSGTFFMRRSRGDAWVAAPTLATEVAYQVSGIVARAKVLQRFHNQTEDWVEGVYVFPLPERAAVDHLRMKVGERIIEGQIREREQAQAEYQQARASGRKASLVEQERPNIFTTSVANLGPGEELEVEIELQQTLSFDEGEVRLRFPLVVGPRYIPGAVLPGNLPGLGWAPNTVQVPDAARITPPVLPPWEAPRNLVRLEVELDAGFPVEKLFGRYLPILYEQTGEGRYEVRLRDAWVPADRDFELAWTPQPGTLPRSAVFQEEHGEATYVLLTLFPPVGPAVESSRLRREVVYVIDTSGSMSGASIEQARKALLLAVDRLRAGDRFNVIQFNSETDVLFDAARPLTEKTRAAAKEYVAGLRAQGGTEMAAALETALVGSDDPRLVRQVVFLTDGSVGNEEQLFGLIRQRLGDTRLFTVGIGSAPNAHFMTKAAQFGHGTFTYIGDLGEVEEKMRRLFVALESPVLTGIEVHWPGKAAVEAWPERMPDLYLGEPVVVSARLEGRPDQVVVTGRRGEQPWRAELPLASGRPGQGMSVLWAQRKIQAVLDSLHEGANPDAVRAAVVALGLEHHLVTRHTSLVAVDVTPSRPADADLKTRPLPTTLPHGWNYESVFGELPQTAAAAPLHLWLAAAALALAALVWRAGRASVEARLS